jgi:type IV secretion system protein TrbL
MDNLNIIDRFMATFTSYIDSGFGLLNGDVAFLTSILIGIDITLAGLFWALEGEGQILFRLVRKVLYVGTFAYIIGNFPLLADIIYRSFAGLGLKVGQNGLTADDLLKPGKLAATGFQAAWPLLQQAGTMIGFTSFFDNIVTVVILLLAWVVVVLAFFILAVQLFITVIEFKLTSLAGFVLVPFALWSKTSFLAERVLGNVISSGIKVMVLAVIVGIGSSFFNDFITALRGQEPNLAQAMSLVLGALTLFGLGIFGPGIAAGLVSGAPQLGAGAAIGAAGAAVGAAMLGGGAALGAARLLGSGGLAAIRAGTSLGSAATTAYGLGAATSGGSGLGQVGAGLSGVARAGGNAAVQASRNLAGRAADGLSESAQAGRTAGWEATGGKPQNGSSNGSHQAAPATSAAPDWAKRLQAQQRQRHHSQATAQAIKEGDRPGAPANPELDSHEE